MVKYGGKGGQEWFQMRIGVQRVHLVKSTLAENHWALSIALFPVIPLRKQLKWLAHCIDMETTRYKISCTSFIYDITQRKSNQFGIVWNPKPV